LAMVNFTITPLSHHGIAEVKGGLLA